MGGTPLHPSGQGRPSNPQLSVSLPRCPPGRRHTGADEGSKGEVGATGPLGPQEPRRAGPGRQGAAWRALPPRPGPLSARTRSAHSPPIIATRGAQGLRPLKQPSRKPGDGGPAAPPASRRHGQSAPGGSGSLPASLHLSRRSKMSVRRRGHRQQRPRADHARRSPTREREGSHVRRSPPAPPGPCPAATRTRGARPPQAAGADPGGSPRGEGRRGGN